MRRFLPIVVMGLLLGVSVWAQSLTVAAAANTRYALEALAEAFEAKSGVRVEPVIASSGKLTAQIEHGAPFDLFLSADMAYPERLYEKGEAATKPKIYAYGTLVVWSLKLPGPDIALSTLASRAVKRVAIPNPKSAPYGREALRVLKRAGLYAKVAPKLVYGESVGQTDRYILSGSVDVGVTAGSVLFAPNLRGRGLHTPLDTALYDPIAQGVVILRHGMRRHPEASRAFYDFLFSPQGRKILRNYGYRVP
ncbi:molybdate ABC transporter substrate-binding protein [Hydrogenimonas sp.]